jgi:excisionase family DNA binding protein
MADWITTRKAVELSGYNIQYLRRLIRKNTITAQRFGNVWQVNRESLLEYLRQAQTSEDHRRGAKTQADT